MTASAFATLHRGLIIALAARYRLPAIFPSPFFAASGGLISVGAVFLDHYRRAAECVDLTLKVRETRRSAGAAPVRLEMAVNRTTATALDLDCRPSCWSTPIRCSVEQERQ